MDPFPTPFLLCYDSANFLAPSTTSCSSSGPSRRHVRLSRLSMSLSCPNVLALFFQTHQQSCDPSHICQTLLHTSLPYIQANSGHHSPHHKSNRHVNPVDNSPPHHIQQLQRNKKNDSEERKGTEIRFFIECLEHCARDNAVDGVEVGKEVAEEVGLGEEDVFAIRI